MIQIFIITVFYFVFLPFQQVLAHPGSLDSSGCHYCLGCTVYGDLYMWEGNLYEYYHCGYNLIIPPNSDSNDTSIGDKLNLIQEQPANIPIVPTYKHEPIPTVERIKFEPLPTFEPIPTWTPRPTWKPSSTRRPTQIPSIQPTLMTRKNTPTPTVIYKQTSHMTTGDVLIIIAAIPVGIFTLMALITKFIARKGL